MVLKICYKKMKKRLVVLDEGRQQRTQRKGVVTSTVPFVNENP